MGVEFELRVQVLLSLWEVRLENAITSPSYSTGKTCYTARAATVVWAVLCMFCSVAVAAVVISIGRFPSPGHHGVPLPLPR